MKLLSAFLALVTYIDVISAMIFPEQVTQYYATPSSEDIEITASKILKSANTSRISALKCEEYTSHLTDIIYYGGLSLLSKPIELKRTKCTGNDMGLIVGGEKAKAKEFVHMAAIGWDIAEQSKETERTYNFLCGGSLISERFVLTAAHCKFNRLQQKPIVVRLGALNIHKSDASPFEDYVIEEFISHDQFDRIRVTNDIAVIKLNRKVTFNDYIRPACLPKDNNLNDAVIATGWGMTKNGRASQDLLKVVLNVVNTDFCRSKYNPFSRQIFDSQICVGDQRGKDTCRGDSGSPIQVFHPFHFCVAVVVGVTSYGPTDCGNGLPGVYTRIFSYLDWIEGKVWLQI